MLDRDIIFALVAHLGCRECLRPCRAASRGERVLGGIAGDPKGLPDHAGDTVGDVRFSLVFTRTSDAANCAISSSSATTNAIGCSLNRILSS